jgi:MFS family permease
MTTDPPAGRNPWFVVGGSGIAQSVSAQPLLLSTFSLFVAPLATETGWGRASILAAFTACAAGMAIGMPIVGKLLDRFTARFVILVSWLAYCACVALLSVTPLALPQFYVPFFFIGLFASGTLIPFTKAIVSWFDNKRGAAIGISAALMGLGTTFTPLIAGKLIAVAGFQQAYLWLALFALIVGLAMILPFVRGRSEHGIYRSKTAGGPVAGPASIGELPGLTVGEALRTRHFWMIATALCLTGIAVVGVQANLVPIMAARGIILEHATIALSVFGFASLLGRLGGILLDRFHGTFVGSTVLALALGGILLLLFGTSFATAVAGSALIGLAFGMEIDLLAFLTSRYFGMRHFGTLLGILQGAVLLCIATGPLIIGVAYDKTGSYSLILQILAATFGLCAVLILLLGRYPFPAIEGFDKRVADDAAVEAP